MAYFIRRYDGRRTTQYLKGNDWADLDYADEFDSREHAAQLARDWKEYSDSKGDNWNFDVQCFDSRKGRQTDLFA